MIDLLLIAQLALLVFSIVGTAIIWAACVALAIQAHLGGRAKR